MNPKSLGYWQRVCRGGGHTEDSITGSEVNCIRAHSCTFRDRIFSSLDICAELQRINPQQTCEKAKQELLALLLNVCHGRLTFSNAIDSRCAANTSVGGAFSEADGILCDPAPTEQGCDLAGCEAREINQGRALHVHALVLTRLYGGSIRLVWTAPLADVGDLTATPRRYRIWRAAGTSTPLVQIAEVPEASFEDGTADGPLLVYDVTPVW